MQNEGAIGFLGSTRDSDTGAFYNVDRLILEAQYGRNSSYAYNAPSQIMGEAVLESKLKLYSLRYIRQYNLYGDPAVNLWPNGFTCTEDITLSGTVDISSDITVNSGVTLTIAAGTNIVFHGYHGITILSGGNIVANGTQNSRITFTAAAQDLDHKWKIIRLDGGDSEFHYCTFEYAYYPIYLNGCTSSEGNANLFDHCIFRNNASYGMRASGSVAEIIECDFTDNSQGLYSYNSDIDLSGNYFANNTIGIKSQTGSALNLHGNVIEDNSSYGFSTQSADDIILGEYYNFQGYNTIRNNGSHELYAGSNNPEVLIHYNSIHGSGGSDFEIFNYSSNHDNLEATQNWFGYDDACQSSGDVHIQTIYPDVPGWDGNQIDYGYLHKYAASKDGDYDDFLIDRTLPKEEQLIQCKNIIAQMGDKKEATQALAVMYSILRQDYFKNELAERENFYSFLESLLTKYAAFDIGKRAFIYFVVWNMLDHKNDKVIQLCNEGVKTFHELDSFLLSVLGYAYLNKGWIEEATFVLEQMINCNCMEPDELKLLAEDISETKDMIAKGILQPDGKNVKLAPDFDSSNTELVNYPNPGNPSTVINFHLPESKHVNLAIYNLMGQRVRILIDENRQAGSHAIVWNGKNDQGTDVSSGIYLYSLNVDGKVFTNKLTLIR